MERSEAQFAQAKLARLKSDYQVDILTDWGEEKPEGGGEWRPGAWVKAELDKLDNAIALVADAMGGNEKFIRNLGGLTIRKADIGSHGGEALSHRVSLSTKGSFSSWTVVHEFAHAWDANHGWKLSRLLEKYTGGYTSPVLSLAKRLAGLSDSGLFSPEKNLAATGENRAVTRQDISTAISPAARTGNLTASKTSPNRLRCI
jgi:hypothetical protein